MSYQVVTSDNYRSKNSRNICIWIYYIVVNKITINKECNYSVLPPQPTEKRIIPSSMASRTYWYRWTLCLELCSIFDAGRRQSPPSALVTCYKYSSQRDMKIMRQKIHNTFIPCWKLFADAQKIVLSKAKIKAAKHVLTLLCLWLWLNTPKRNHVKGHS